MGMISLRRCLPDFFAGAAGAAFLAGAAAALTGCCCFLVAGAGEAFFAAALGAACFVVVLAFDTVCFAADLAGEDDFFDAVLFAPACCFLATVALEVPVFFAADFTADVPAFLVVAGLDFDAVDFFAVVDLAVVALAFEEVTFFAEELALLDAGFLAAAADLLVLEEVEFLVVAVLAFDEADFLAAEFATFPVFALDAVTFLPAEVAGFLIANLLDDLAFDVVALPGLPFVAADVPVLAFAEAALPEVLALDEIAWPVDFAFVTPFFEEADFAAFDDEVVDFEVDLAFVSSDLAD